MLCENAVIPGSEEDNHLIRKFQLLLIDAYGFLCVQMEVQRKLNMWQRLQVSCSPGMTVLQLIFHTSKHSPTTYI